MTISVMTSRYDYISDDNISDGCMGLKEAETLSPLVSDDHISDDHRTARRRVGHDRTSGHSLVIVITDAVITDVVCSLPVGRRDLRVTGQRRRASAMTTTVSDDLVSDDLDDSDDFISDDLDELSVTTLSVSGISDDYISDDHMTIRKGLKEAENRDILEK
jgi:hypothetical protein